MRFNRAQLIPRQKNKLEELRAEVSSSDSTMLKPQQEEDFSKILGVNSMNCRYRHGCL